MSGMVERVAKAIYEEDDPWHKAWPWPNLSEKQAGAEAYRRCARAAIEAMREPTEAMVNAAYGSRNAGGYDAMISAALNEEG